MATRDIFSNKMYYSFFGFAPVFKSYFYVILKQGAKFERNLKVLLMEVQLTQWIGATACGIAATAALADAVPP